MHVEFEEFPSFYTSIVWENEIAECMICKLQIPIETPVMRHATNPDIVMHTECFTEIASFSIMQSEGNSVKIEFTIELNSRNTDHVQEIREELVNVIQSTLNLIQTESLLKSRILQ